MAAADIMPEYLKAGLKLAELSLKQNQREKAIALYAKFAALAHAHGQLAYAELAESNLHRLQNSP